MTARPEREEPAPSAAIAAAEAEIAATRRRLDAALAGTRYEYALSLAAAEGIGVLLKGGPDAKTALAFMRRNAGPLAAMALGAIWFAALNRETIRQRGPLWAEALLDHARRIAGTALTAAGTGTRAEPAGTETAAASSSGSGDRTRPTASK